MAFFVLSLSLSANNLESSLSFSEANLLLIGSSFWPRKGLGTRESNNFFGGCKFDPKKQLLDADDVIGGKYVINAEY